MRRGTLEVRSADIIPEKHIFNRLQRLNACFIYERIEG